MAKNTHNRQRERAPVGSLSGPRHRNQTRDGFPCCSWHPKTTFPNVDKLSASGYYGGWESKWSVGAVLREHHWAPWGGAKSGLVPLWTAASRLTVLPGGQHGNKVAALKITPSTWPERLLNLAGNGDVLYRQITGSAPHPTHRLVPFCYKSQSCWAPLI